MVRSENLTFRYHPSRELLFPDFHIEENQHTLLLGDSGTGKTTLLHLLGGLSRPSTGEITIGTQNLYALHGSALDNFRSRNIGFIFQEAHLLKNLSILENILLAQSLANFKSDKKEATGLLEKLNIGDQAHKHPNQLSRGQLQRAAIARAVINKPHLLLADEPTAALDDTNTEHVIDLLLEIAQSADTTLVIATHDKRLKDRFSHTYTL